jgi:general secretion pathway protein G
MPLAAVTHGSPSARRCPRGAAGFTLLELLVTVAILSVLAAVTLPLAERTVTRAKEQELRVALRQIREGIDAYKRAHDEGRIPRRVGDSGYPPSLEILVEGVVDPKSPTRSVIRFMRRIPRNPFWTDPATPAARTWGRRSYESPHDSPREGDDVFDVYVPGETRGLNGIAYREW